MKVSILGYAQTKFKEHWNKGINELIFDVGSKALTNSGLKNSDVDHIICANSFAPLINNKSVINSICYEILNISSNITISSGDASGALAIQQAINDIESGRNKRVMVLGVEKMSDLLVKQTASVTSQLIDPLFEAYNGATLISIFALMQRVYMEKYGISEEDIAQIPIKNHENALSNKNALFKFAIKKEDVLKSTIVSSPIRNLNCAAFYDGAAAIILGREEDKEEKLQIIGTGASNDNLAIQSRKNIIELEAVAKASKQGLDQAGIGIKDIDIVEVHDTTSVAEIFAVEALELCEEGKGLDFINNNKLMVNRSGGLKACGHALAATGIRQIIDVCNFMLEDNKIKYGLAQNMSGTGSNAVVNIISRGE